MYHHHFTVFIDLCLGSLNKRQAEILIQRLMEGFLTPEDLRDTKLSGGGREKGMEIIDPSLNSFASGLWGVIEDIKKGDQPNWDMHEIQQRFGGKALMDRVMHAIGKYHAGLSEE